MTFQVCLERIQSPIHRAHQGFVAALRDDRAGAECQRRVQMPAPRTALLAETQGERISGT